jgi:hypothetical protein
MNPSKYSRIMKWIRRVHLYLGLFLVPWILLYGITGFLFNHPGAFSDHAILEMKAGSAGSALLSSMPSADSVAEKALNLFIENYKGDKPEIKMAPNSRPRYVNNGHLNLKEEGFNHFLNLNVKAGTAELHSYKVPDKFNLPYSKPVWFDLDDSLSQRVEQEALAAVKSKGYNPESANWRFGPSVQFNVLLNGKPWKADYNLGQGRFNLMPERGWPSTQTFRQFLLRLHRTHIYGSQSVLQIIWALFVDIIALSMIWWALSGIIMLWQLKSIRRTGIALISISLVWGIGLFYLMFELFRKM